jgi:2-polyprenyl-3-methyl-5-hydroxy-6-metoxy-1,4-benzoquinol methylase
MVQCTECGLVYLNPRPPQQQIDEAAETGLHRYGGAAVNVVGAYSTRRSQYYERMLREILTSDIRTASSVSWLDIGAGHGELVAAVKRLGIPGVLGIEPCKPKVVQAATRGLPVRLGTIGDMDETFSHISLINVYSHLPDPVAFLTRIRRLLLPGGILLLVTGNGADVPRDEVPGALYLPDHLSFAGERHLPIVLDRAGFDSLRVLRAVPHLSFDSPLVTRIKNLARRLTGRHALPTSISGQSKFRTLWILATVRPEGSSRQ